MCDGTFWRVLLRHLTSNAETVADWRIEPHGAIDLLVAQADDTD